MLKFPGVECYTIYHTFEDTTYCISTKGLTCNKAAAAFCASTKTYIYTYILYMPIVYKWVYVDKIASTLINIHQRSAQFWYAMTAHTLLIIRLVYTQYRMSNAVQMSMDIRPLSHFRAFSVAFII